MSAKPPKLLTNVVDLLLDAVFMVDVHGKIAFVSAACERILGYSQQELIGRSMLDLVAPEDRARTLEEAGQVMAGLPRIGFENRYVRKDGSHATLMWSARWSEADQMRIGVARDLSEHRQLERRQAATYAISEAAHAAVDLPAMLCDVHHIIARLLPVAGFAAGLLNEADGSLEFPYGCDGGADTPLTQELHAARLCGEAITCGTAMPQVVLAGASDASIIAVPLTSSDRTIGALLVRSHDGCRYGESDCDMLQFVATQVAASIERYRLHARLLVLAQYDELTGLPNRRLLHDRGRHALAVAGQEQRQAAVLYIDLDDFKRINDTLGHDAGDELLRVVGHRLKQCIRIEDTVARLGGDEFVVVLEHIQHADDASRIAAKIRSSVMQVIQLGEHRLSMRPSIGIALYPEHGSGIEQLLRHADQAMYAVKKDKGGAGALQSGVSPGPG